MSEAVAATDILDVVRILPDVLFRCYKAEDGKIYWSLNEGGLAEQFHLTTKEIEGKSLEELFPGGASSQLRQHFELAFQGESTIFTNQIGDRHFRHFPKPILDAEGNVVEVVGYIADVTDLVNTQEELRRANQELDAFVYSVSHDVRNPLTALSTLTQVFNEHYRDRLDAAGRQYLERMASTIASMQGMTGALLSLSRARNAPLVRRDVDLSAIAHDVVQSLQMQARDRSVMWVIAPGLRAQADKDLMRILLQNLLGNAWKFTAGAPARIEFAQREDGAFVVRDNGPGFEPDMAAALFEPFRRLHEGFEGTGIGLHTVDRIVRRHGGQVGATGSPGIGAEFWFTLP